MLTQSSATQTKGFAEVLLQTKLLSFIIKYIGNSHGKLYFCKKISVIYKGARFIGGGAICGHGTVMW